MAGAVVEGVKTVIGRAAIYHRDNGSMSIQANFAQDSDVSIDDGDIPKKLSILIFRNPAPPGVRATLDYHIVDWIPLSR